MFISVLSLAGLAAICHCSQAIQAQIPSSASKQSVPIAKDFTSFSIEYNNLPYYGGNHTHPNQFSINLLSNLGRLTGMMPVIRVGGSTQDDIVYNASLTIPEFTDGVRVGDHRPLIYVGPSFFTSYNTFPNTRYIPGINLAINGTAGVVSRKAQIELTCKALGDNLFMFEVGNEPDHFIGYFRRPANWTVQEYVSEWLEASKLVLQETIDACPQTARRSPGFFAPSFGGTDLGQPFSALTAFQDGQLSMHDIRQISIHNYMGSATNPAVTLQGTLMNHSSIMNSLAAHVTLAAELRNYTSVPYVLGETNSLSGGGASGLSNVFGSALWVVDYSLYAASQGILRAHFHQSTTSPYTAWTPNGTLTTNPPYYGNIMVNAAVGSAPDTVISSLQLQNNEDPRISAYILHDSNGGKLSRVVLLNMREWNSTTMGSRTSLTFTLTVPPGVHGARVERLSAAGADVTTGVTYAGTSYDYDLGLGKPVVVDREAATEEVMVEKRTQTLAVKIEDTEGVVLHLF